MKHISILRLLAGGLIFTTASCSLDYDPVDMYSDVTEGVQKEEDKGVVFKDKAAVEAHLQTLYDQMRDRQEHWYQDMFLIGDTHSDNAYAGTRSGAPQYFESNTIPSTIAPLQRGWNRFMEDIARANKLICNIDAVTDASLTVQERESYKAQAKIFRAMIYFDMVRNWGRIPIVITEAGDITSETIEEVYPAYFPAQNTEEEVYRQIEKDLLEAISAAPDNNPEDKTRFSKSVARTLLAKVYAEEPLRDYTKVIKYCDEVAADGFRLADKFNDLFGVKMQDETLPPSWRYPSSLPPATDIEFAFGLHFYRLPTLSPDLAPYKVPKHRENAVLRTSKHGIAGRKVLFLSCTTYLPIGYAQSPDPNR